MFNTWHADIPGPTLVNRAYIDSATSAGEFCGAVLPAGDTTCGCTFGVICCARRGRVQAVSVQ